MFVKINYEHRIFQTNKWKIALIEINYNNYIEKQNT